jgi:uncharacterized protein DUF3137
VVTHNFAEFRHNTLLPALKQFEAQRVPMVMCGFLFVALQPFLLIGLMVGMWHEWMWVILTCIVAGAVSWGAALYWMQRWKVLNRRYKREVVGRIVGFVNPELHYASDEYVGYKLASKSRLFPETDCTYGGDDLVAGKIGNTRMGFSELSIRQNREGGGCQWWLGRGNESPVFSGVIFVAEFNKRFTGFTILLPDTAERLAGTWLGRLAQGLNVFQPGELQAMEDPDFEKYFAVYSSSEFTARYVLTPGLMRRLVKLRRRVGSPITVSFSEACVFVTWPTKKELFEMSWTRSLLSQRFLLGTYRLVTVLAGIVEDLDLNTRIWTKA